MGSNNKRKTTRAKLDRERKLVERRLQKEAKRIARRQAAEQPPELDAHGSAGVGE